jgi:hypothetical protein
MQLPCQAHPRFTPRMGKIDDMRKRREQQFAEKEGGAGGSLNGAAKRPGEAARDDGGGPDGGGETKSAAGPRTKMRSGKSPAGSAAADVKGKCSACGKVRAVQNGLIVNHQKGLGKMCAGSRKKPA